MRKFFIFAILTWAAFGCDEGPEGRESDAQAVPGVKVVVADGETDKERLVYPRAIAAGADDSFYVIDRSGLVKRFSSEGRQLLSWKLPLYENGTPTGIALDKDGNVLVADTHYSRVLIYSPEGKLLRQFGGYGTGEGQFTYITDIVLDSSGNIYTCDYGRTDCVQKFKRDGTFLAKWTFEEQGGLNRPMALACDSRDNIYLADSCNHRVIKMTSGGAVLAILGGVGSAEGEFKYPYDLTVDKGDCLYVCEYGNNRIQKFTGEGEFLRSWGRPGRGLRELASPWAVALDSTGAVLIADTNNQRILKTDAMRN